MALSIKQISEVISEIASELKGGMIRRIDQPSSKCILFEIEHQQQRHRLLFSAHRDYARCHLSFQKERSKKLPPGFCQLLRAHFRHKKIRVIRQLEGDRIVVIEAAWSGEDEKPLRFVAEMTGSTSNFFLIDHEGHLMGSLLRPQASRHLSQGAPYLPPTFKTVASFKETPIPLIAPEPFRLNRSISAYYFALEQSEAEAAAKKERFAQFDARIRQLKKKLNRFRALLLESEKSVKYRQYGEYLKCHLHEIQSGADHFKYHASDSTEAKEVLVQLDPALSPPENMMQFFKRYKKGQAGKAIHASLIEETEVRLLQLEAGRKAFSEGGVIDPVAFGLSPTQKKQLRKKEKKSPPTYLSSDRLRLMVGRNDRENEEITFRIARGNDLWFHVRGAPGSHVLVRMEKRKDIPPQTLLEAASLALHFSRYKKEGKGEVMYTFKKYIQRPKKGKRGSVICSQEKAIFLEIDPKHLSKVLENRIEAE